MSDFSRERDRMVALQIARRGVRDRHMIVPYGLYRAHGFISAKLAERTGFSGDDLDLFWYALQNMLDHDRSAARGEMAARRLIVFRHASALGNAPAHKLFDLVQVPRKNPDDPAPARQFGDYTVRVGSPPEGVELLELIQ
jgi:CRISPR-associated protein Csd2